MRLFVYGSLLDPHTLSEQGGQPGLAERLVPGVLHGWQRVRLRGTPWPTLRRARGRQIAGALLTTSAAVQRRLTAYEGNAYRLVRVTVQHGTRAVPAHAWIAVGATDRSWPD